MTAGTDIKVLNKEMSTLRKGNSKKANIKAISIAKGVAIKIADIDTPNESEIISQISS
jgi:hypothetical protein